MLHPITGETLVPITPEFPEQERMQRMWDNWRDELAAGFDTADMQEDSQ